jgi:hypothetical protein
MPHPALKKPFLLFLLILASCGDPKSNDSGSPDAPAASAQLAFVDISKSAGIVLENVSGDPLTKMAIPENLGQGVAVLDYDSDGLFDIFIANGDVFPGQKPRSDPRCALYRNKGQGKF